MPFIIFQQCHKSTMIRRNGYGIRGIVAFTIIPDQLNIVKNFFNCLISVLFEFLINGAQIHGILDEELVI